MTARRLLNEQLSSTRHTCALGLELCANAGSSVPGIARLAGWLGLVTIATATVRANRTDYAAGSVLALPMARGADLHCACEADTKGSCKG